MSQTVAEGDRVRVADRDVVAADVKSQLYYEHYRGLVGTIRKIYADSTAAVIVDTEDLTTEQAASQRDVAEWVRDKELGKQSEEAKNKLSAAEKKFNVPYAILVSVNDLSPAGPDDHSGKAAGISGSAARKSLTEIEEAEARHFEEIKRATPSDV